MLRLHWTLSCFMKTSQARARHIAPEEHIYIPTLPSSQKYQNNFNLMSALHYKVYDPKVLQKNTKIW